MRAFLSPPPEVEITNAFVRPFDNVVATARTCYSAKGVVTSDDVSGPSDAGDALRAEKAAKRDSLAKELYKAGHHTTLQHAHFQFALSNVSRHFIWSFLHSHPFYNSEQVSQRYVKVKPGSYAVPPLEGRALEIFHSTVEAQNEAYAAIAEALRPRVSDEYFKRFPARGRSPESWKRDISKKAQEAARYVLPVATFAYLYHTVSGLTLLRYYRTCASFDTPLEQRIVLDAMVGALLRHDPAYRAVLESPRSEEETVEFEVMRSSVPANGSRSEFLRDFDADLGGRISRLADYPARNEETVAQSVREIFGLPRNLMSDEEALALALDPSRNSWLGETLNITTHTKISRALFHAHYTFRKRLSHTADSQNQRHRMTPGSRPILAAHYTGEPDYVTPGVIAEEPKALALYEEIMKRSWEAIESLRSAGVEDEFALYLLPNAAAIRFTESTDLLNLRHKLAMRLCYNAQEEIWRASLDEARQICEVNPRIGKFLLPPCTLRMMAKTSPICPEGKRYCGERVWTYDLPDFERVI
ncbi:MAG TPA: FAD-dependent thymidylate synthase [Candidatus Saccharimonadales bacterium]|nr:FAD-dependent thymidylate synthase [Candidatus Saccharimonadales bacterium]